MTIHIVSEDPPSGIMLAMCGQSITTLTRITHWYRGDEQRAARAAEDAHVLLVDSWVTPQRDRFSTCELCRYISLERLLDDALQGGRREEEDDTATRQGLPPGRRT